MSSQTTVLEEELIAPAPPSIAPPQELSGRTTFWLLAFLTVLAGILRFTLLSRPPLLIDECFTFWRTCGSYQDLIDTLRDDGFVPLHYELLWWIKQGFPIGHFHLFTNGLYLTPTLMRFVPAITGTIMIPVIYFVARQLFDRRTSVLAAAFVACSAYATFFSRDAKMYMPAWMLGTLGEGCLMCWLRTRTTTAWLGWIAAAAAAGGVHVVTLLLLVLAPLFLLTQRKTTWQQCALLLLGVTLIAAGPAGYYLSFNRWAEKSGGLVPGVTSEPAPDANWDASGLNWIGARPPAPAAFESLSGYLTAYEWAGDPNDADSWDTSPNWIRHMFITTVSTMLTLLVIGLLPWPKNWRGTRGIPQPERQWRSTLWLLSWIILPAYGFFYCRSYPSPASPSDWLQAAASLWGHDWPWMIAISILLAAAALRWRHIRSALGMVVIVACASILLPTLFAPTGVLTNLTTSRALNLIALIILPAAIFVFSGHTLAERFQKLFRAILVLSLILLICAGANTVWNSLRAASYAKHPELTWQTIWHTRYMGIIWPAIWIGAAALVMRLPTLPLRIFAIAVFTVPNYANAVAKYAVQTQVPYDRVFADVWLAKPDSPLRTYFDLNTMPFAESGLPTSVYWKPMVAYSAALAAHHPTNPTDFRNGKSWPFEYGPMLQWFQNSVAYRPYTAPSNIASDLSNSPTIQRIIIWRAQSLAPDSAKAMLDRLGKSWTLVNQEDITDWWYWTWSPRASFSRLEFVRSAEAKSNTNPR